MTTHSIVSKSALEISAHNPFTSLLESPELKEKCKKIFSKFTEERPLSLNEDLGKFFEIKVQSIPEMVELSYSNLPAEIETRKDHPITLIRKESTSWLGGLFDTIAMPTDLGLMMISAHYGKKYGIEILICSTPPSVKNAILGSGLDESCRLWGLIITSGDPHNPHVTPAICFRKKDGMLQILELDSVTSPTALFQEGIDCVAKSGLPLEVFSVIYPRQADHYSCRTDACVVLKDALRDLKTHKIEDFNEILTRPYAHAPMHRFSLPAPWAKTVQISSLVTSSALATIINEKKAETLGAFYERYTQIFIKKHTFHITYKLDTEDPLKIFSETSTLVQEKRMSSFLNLKGKALLLEINQILKQEEPDFEIRMRLDILKSLYS